MAGGAAASVGPAAGRVSHSTSWRHVAPDRLVLTYAVVPDPDPARPAIPLDPAGIVSSGDPLLPAPAEIHDHHVAAHAVRHLAYLAETDPTVRTAARQHPALWAAIARYAASTPVGTHSEVHALAEAAP